MQPQNTSEPQRARLQPKPLTLPTRGSQSATDERGSLFQDDWLDAEWGSNSFSIPALGGNSSTSLPVPPMVRRTTTRPARSGAQTLPPPPASSPGDPGAAAPFTPLEGVEDVADMATLILPAIGATDISQFATVRLPAVVAGTETYFSLLARLARSSGVYALATMASPLVSLALSPFLTRYLSPSDYGTLALLNSMTGLLAGITQLGLGSAFFRAYNYDYTEDRDRRSVLGTSLLLLGTISVLASGLLAYLAPWIATTIFGQPALARPLIVMAWVLLVQNLTVPGFAWLRAESKALFFALLSITNLLVALIANFVFVGALQLGVEGSLLATGSGYALVALVTLPALILASHLRVGWRIGVGMLAFGLPLVLNFTSFWVLQLSDRYLLALLGSLADTAKYAVAYSLGGVISTVVMSPFTLAWPTAMFSIAKRRDAARVFSLVFRWFSTLLLFAAFALSIAARMILIWFFPAAYHSAELIIPIISESLVFYGVYYIFMAGANVTRRTWLAAVFTTTAALLNIGLNVAFIPLWGSFGAAAATLLSYMAMALLAYLVNQRIYPVPFEIVRFLVAFTLGVTIYIASYSLADTFGAQYRWLLAIGGLALFALCLFILVDGARMVPVRRALPALKSRMSQGREKGALHG
ncbi:MAG TPA: polysaccharide biosynthesis C-terminal domain-containing protein [Ktedonobacterales bacterium]